jgi:hypothetical protein
MSCLCINTAVLMENENEKLRVYIKTLERKVEKYQKELLCLYISESDNSSIDSRGGSLNGINSRSIHN